MEVKSLNIAYVLPHFDPARGGAESYLKNLVDDVVARGHRVTICCTSASIVSTDFETKKFSVSGSAASRIQQFWDALDHHFSHKKYDIIHSLDLCPRMNVHNPHGGAEKIWLEQYLKSKKGVDKIWASLKRTYGARQKKVFELEEKQIHDPHLKKIIAISPFVKDSLQAVYQIEDQMFSLVPNGVDLKQFSPVKNEKEKEHLRQTKNVAPGDYVILFVAHNYPLKGLDNVIETIKELKGKLDRNIKVAVIGKGKSFSFKRRISQRGLEDQFLFLGPVNDIENWYKLADLCFAPTWYDACSLSTLEALASGLPVITSRFNGAGMYIEEGVTGHVVNDPSDVHDNTRAILEFVAQDKLLKAREAGPRSLKSYTQEENTKKILEVYREILGM